MAKIKFIVLISILIIIIVLIVILLQKNNILGFVVLNEDEQKSNIDSKVKIAYLPIVQGLPLYLSIEKDYFKEAGIEVEAIKFDSPQLILNALIAGQVDIGAPSTASGITGVTEYKKPGELKIFALIGDNDTTTNYVLIARNDYNLKAVKDLKNRKLGVIPGIQFRTLAQHILAQNNLTIEKDVTLVELTPGLQLQALASGQVDAVLTLEPIRAMARLKGVGKELVEAPALKFVSNPFYGSVGVVRAQYLKENPEAAEKILQVFNRAIEEINENPDSARQYLKGYTPLDEQLISEVPLPVFKMYQNFSKKDIDALQKWFDVFTKYGIIDGRVDAQKLVLSEDKE